MSIHRRRCCCGAGCCDPEIGRTCRLPSADGSVDDLDVVGGMTLRSSIEGLGTVTRLADWTAAALAQVASACVLVETGTVTVDSGTGTAVDEAWSKALSIASAYTQPATMGGPASWTVTIAGEIIRVVGDLTYRVVVAIIVRVAIVAGAAPCIHIDAASLTLDPIGPCIICAPWVMPLPLRVSFEARGGEDGECPTTLSITCPETGVFEAVGDDDAYFAFACGLELTQPESVIRECAGSGELTDDCVGACCTDGSCTETTALACIAGGGTWRGSGTECESTACLGSGTAPPPCYPGVSTCAFNLGTVDVEFDLLATLTIRCCVSGTVVEHEYTQEIVETVVVTRPGPDCADVEVELDPFDWPEVLSCFGGSLGEQLYVSALFACGTAPGGGVVPIASVSVSTATPIAVNARARSANLIELDRSQEYLTAKCPPGTGTDYVSATLRVQGRVRAVGRSSGDGA